MNTDCTPAAEVSRIEVQGNAAGRVLGGAFSVAAMRQMDQGLPPTNTSGRDSIFAWVTHGPDRAQLQVLEFDGQLGTEPRLQLRPCTDGLVVLQST